MTGSTCSSLTNPPSNSPPSYLFTFVVGPVWSVIRLGSTFSAANRGCLGRLYLAVTSEFWKRFLLSEMVMRVGKSTVKALTRLGLKQFSTGTQQLCDDQLVRILVETFVRRFLPSPSWFSLGVSPVLRKKPHQPQTKTGPVQPVTVVNAAPFL